MKTRNLLFALILFISIPALSQIPEGKNVAKLNLSALLLKSIHLQYERQVSQRMTVALGYSIVPKSSLAFTSAIQDIIDDKQVRVKDFKMGTSIITPEVRYYFGKRGAFHGFYLAPYIRISSYQLQGPVEFFSATNTEKAVFEGTLHAYTGGLMAGSSFQLSKMLYLDWWIIGGSFGGASGSFVAKTPLTPSDQLSLKSVLDDLNVPLTTIKSEVDGNGATVSTSGSMAGVRSLGINLGIRF